MLNLATLGGTSAAAQLTTRVTASLGRPALFSTARHILASEVGAVGGAAEGVGHLGREIKLLDGFYQAEGSAFKFSQFYYEKLWATGRGAPFVQAEHILSTARSITRDRMAGFYRYTNEYMEMVYNPTTKKVWHLMPLQQ